MNTYTQHLNIYGYFTSLLLVNSLMSIIVCTQQKSSCAIL